MLYPNPCYNKVCYKGTALQHFVFPRMNAKMLIRSFLREVSNVRATKQCLFEK